MFGLLKLSGEAVKGLLLYCVESMLLSSFLRIPLMGEFLLPVEISFFLFELSNACAGVEIDESLRRRRQMGS